MDSLTLIWRHVGRSQALKRSHQTAGTVVAVLSLVFLFGEVPLLPQKVILSPLPPNLKFRGSGSSLNGQSCFHVGAEPFGGGLEVRLFGTRVIYDAKKRP